MIEQRRHTRASIECPLSFSRKGRSDGLSGIGRDISLGGMFVETTSPCAFKAEIVIHVKLPSAAHVLALPAVVRWVRADGMGVQFGLLGALETHAITELSR